MMINSRILKRIKNCKVSSTKSGYRSILVSNIYIRIVFIKGQLKCAVF